MMMLTCWTWTVGREGLMAGLTIGLMSIDSMNLQILANGGGTEKEKNYGTIILKDLFLSFYDLTSNFTQPALRILPLVKRHHLLLVTLLIANAAAMEALPIFIDRLVGPIGAILISVTAVLLFGEYAPQSPPLPQHARFKAYQQYAACHSWRMAHNTLSPHTDTRERREKREIMGQACQMLWRRCAMGSERERG